MATRSIDDSSRPNQNALASTLEAGDGYSEYWDPALGKWVPYPNKTDPPPTGRTDDETGPPGAPEDFGKGGLATPEEIDALRRGGLSQEEFDELLKNAPPKVAPDYVGGTTGGSDGFGGYNTFYGGGGLFAGAGGPIGATAFPETFRTGSAGGGVPLPDAPAFTTAGAPSPSSLTVAQDQTSAVTKQAGDALAQSAKDVAPDQATASPRAILQALGGSATPGVATGNRRAFGSPVNLQALLNQLR